MFRSPRSAWLPTTRTACSPETIAGICSLQCISDHCLTFATRACSCLNSVKLFWNMLGKHACQWLCRSSLLPWRMNVMQHKFLHTMVARRLFHCMIQGLRRRCENMCRSCLDCLTAPLYDSKIEKETREYVQKLSWLPKCRNSYFHMLLSMLQLYDHLMHEVLTYHDQSACRLKTQTWFQSPWRDSSTQLI